MKLIGYFIIAILLFVLLKLLQVITWSWWLVILVPYCFVTMCYAVPLIYCLIKHRKKEKRNDE